MLFGKYRRKLWISTYDRQIENLKGLFYRKLCLDIELLTCKWVSSKKIQNSFDSVFQRISHIAQRFVNPWGFEPATFRQSSCQSAMIKGPRRNFLASEGAVVWKSATQFFPPYQGENSLKIILHDDENPFPHPFTG